MRASPIDSLGLRKMPRGWRCIGWIIGGPAISLLIAYIAFLLLLVICGRATNIDTKGTSGQDFLAKLVLPIVCAIIVVGFSYSLFKAIDCWRQKHDEERA